MIEDPPRGGPPHSAYETKKTKYCKKTHPTRRGRRHAERAPYNPRRDRSPIYNFRRHRRRKRHIIAPRSIDLYQRYIPRHNRPIDGYGRARRRRSQAIDRRAQGADFAFRVLQAGLVWRGQDADECGGRGIGDEVGDQEMRVAGYGGGADCYRERGVDG